MKTITILAILSFLSCSTSALAESADQGAKSMFRDSTSGASFVGNAAKSANTSKKKTSRKEPAPSVTQTAEVSGLMYYVELVSPKGEASRVTTDRVFRTGERIRLHVVPSIDGQIVVYQRAPDGRNVVLFPDPQSAVGNPVVTKGADTVLPSPTAWFRFDGQQGIEELTIVLLPRTSADPQRQQQVASIATELASLVSGGKGLLVETDKTGAEQATYVVRRNEGNGPLQPISVGVQLVHR